MNREGTEVTSAGRAFQTRAPATDICCFAVFSYAFKSGYRLPRHAHPNHYMFVSKICFRGRRIDWHYFRLDQIEDGGHEIGAEHISPGRLAYLRYEEAGNKRAALN